MQPLDDSNKGCYVITRKGSNLYMHAGNFQTGWSVLVFSGNSFFERNPSGVMLFDSEAAARSHADRHVYGGRGTFKCMTYESYFLMRMVEVVNGDEP